MKKLNQVVAIIGIVMLSNFKVNAQVSILGNSGSSSDYVGWNSSQGFPLTIAQKNIGSPQNINLWTNGSQKMTILGSSGSDDGYMGIGITTPAYKLDVNGDINIPFASSFSSTYKMGGLDVLRHCNVGGTPNSLYIGIGAGALGSVLIPANTFVGYNAGNKSNLSGASLGNNTFIGFEAGKNNTDGQ